MQCVKKLKCVLFLSALTISAHAQSQTLLQTAVLAAVPVCSVNQTVPLAGTRVHGIVLLASTEETLDTNKYKYTT